MISKYDHKNKKIKHFSANGCLLPLCAVDGMAVTTVEGIGSTKTTLHAVQERIAKSHGSQCGFCTPGIAMSMYTLLRNNPIPTNVEIESAFQGNLCRCTGYRPILEGFKTFTKECCGKGMNGCCGTVNQNGTVNHKTQNGDVMGCNKLFKAEEFTPYDPTQDVIFPPELMLPEAAKPKSLHIKGDLVTWYRPASLEELLELKEKHPQAKLVIGNTKVGIEMKFKNQNYPILIAATHIPELNAVEETADGIIFGASVTLTTLEHVLKDATHSMPVYKTRWFSAILHMLKWFAGHQIRNVAAIGGNIMTASPISDLIPVFMAARCMLTLAAAGGKKRRVRLDESFFTGYRRTILEPSEVLVNILVPFTEKHEYVYAFKQARRRENDIAIVNTGMRVLLEKQGNSSSWKIKDCSFSFGGMAPTTVMAMNTIKGLTGRESISDEEFLTLYESYSSKNPDFPYSAYPKFDYDQIDESACLAEFRVRKQDITLLADVLQLPVTIRCHQRTTCDRTEALCMLLKRFLYPCRYSDMIHRFARPVPEISMITNTVMDHIFLRNSHRISQWNFDILSPPMLQEYADVIHAKGAPLNNCFGFIDGTVRPISRPGQH